MYKITGVREGYKDGNRWYPTEVDRVWRGKYKFTSIFKAFIMILLYNCDYVYIDKVKNPKRT